MVHIEGIVEDPIPQHSKETLLFKSSKRSHDMFLANYNSTLPTDDASMRSKIFCKINTEYGDVQLDALKEQTTAALLQTKPVTTVTHSKPSEIAQMEIQNKKDGIQAEQKAQTAAVDSDLRISKFVEQSLTEADAAAKAGAVTLYQEKNTIATRGPRQAAATPKPDFHPHWKLYRVISGHLGWVRCVAFDPTNEWFATGSNDRTIKVWDLASGTLKLSLTGHISHVRGLAVSPRHPYLFSCGEDKQVKCWDLETNKVIRHYHGHLLAAYDISIHPTLDVIVTASRDGTARVWDMRTKASVHVMSHGDAVLKVRTQGVNPQVITSSMDKTVKLWDLGTGKSITTLTNHKKTVRALDLHPTEFTFASGSADNIKKWKFPRGDFLLNFDRPNTTINTLSMNQDGILVSGGDNGYLHFHDYKTGFKFQEFRSPPQSGSLESEAGVLDLGFDNSGSRLVTCEADKTIKMYKEDPLSNEETHPVLWKPSLIKTRF